MTPRHTKGWAPARPLVADVSPACLCASCALAVGTGKQTSVRGHPLSRRRRWGWGIEHVVALKLRTLGQQSLSWR